jgi:hypothetical protein
MNNDINERKNLVEKFLADGAREKIRFMEKDHRFDYEIEAEKFLSASIREAIDEEILNDMQVIIERYNTAKTFVINSNLIIKFFHTLFPTFMERMLWQRIKDKMDQLERLDK